MYEVVQAYLNWNSKKKKVKNQCITSTEFKNKEYLVKKNATNVMWKQQFETCMVCMCYWLHSWVINELDPLRLNLKGLSLSPDTAFNWLCHLFFHTNWMVSLACHIAV